MIKRLYIDNYKTLVNFEWKPAPMNLLIGGNGSGKSTVFEVLRNLCDFVSGYEVVGDLFPQSSLTAWQTLNLQHFELELTLGDGNYLYKFTLNHDKANKRLTVEEEALYIDGQPLVEVKAGSVQVYNDDHSQDLKYSIDWAGSQLLLISPRNDNKKLTRFKEALRRIVVLKIIPITEIMKDMSKQEDDIPAKHFANFVSWYRFLASNGKIASMFQKDLEEIFDGFSHIQLEKEGQGWHSLQVHFQWEGMRKSTPFYLSQLSEGQRMLIALYSLLHVPESAEKDPDISISEYALFLDEPDNFISLREIQPWLVQLQDKVFYGAVQASIISHHPEVIDYLLVPNNGGIQTFYLERPSGTVTTIKEFTLSPENIVKPSELIARNWI